MESGTVVRWLKQEGERVEKGEPLYELDTEKVTQEVEAEASGVLLKIAVQEGEVPVGQTVAVIGEEGEDVPQAEETEVDETPQEEGSRAPERDAEREEGAEASAARETSEQVTEVREPERNGRVKARRSPAGSRASAGSTSRSSAAPGRRDGSSPRTWSAPIAPAEAPAAAPAAPPPGEVEVVPLTSIRKTIARRLTEAGRRRSSRSPCRRT